MEFCSPLSHCPPLSSSPSGKCYVRNLKTSSKKASVPSCCLFASLVLLIRIGRSRCCHESPILVLMNLSRCELNAGQWKTMCCPSWVWCWHAGQRGSSAFRIRCSHCFIGPRSVLVHVYAERARLLHCVSLPIPIVGIDLYAALACLCSCLMPAWVAVCGSLSSCPEKLLMAASLSAISFPGMPICDLTHEMPVSRCASPLRANVDLMFCSMAERGAWVPEAMLSTALMLAWLSLRRRTWSMFSHVWSASSMPCSSASPEVAYWPRYADLVGRGSSLRDMKWAALAAWPSAPDSSL